MSNESYVNGYDDGKSDCDIEWQKDYEKLEQQLKEATEVIDYYLPILEERLACGAYARQHKKKWSEK
jgi:hypothetical protein